MSQFLDQLAKNEAKSISERLSASTKDELYRLLWKDHVMEDVEAELESTLDDDDNLSFDDKAYIINEVADRYVYGNEYDCNLSYWDNIDNLINDIKKALIEDRENER